VSKTVNVAIIGVGNCASSFVQGVQFYKDAGVDDFVPGLMHSVLGGYHVKDINFTAAIDIDSRKVGTDLADAIFSEPNNTLKFSDVPKTGVTVMRGMTHDGLGKYLSEVIEKAPGETADITGLLKETKTDVVVSYLPVGSEQATKWYVEHILAAGCGFVNCVPVFIGREHYWQERFREAGAPIVGDDIKSQVGATIVHRQLVRLMRERGVRLKHTTQLNFGGNTDFLRARRSARRTPSPRCSTTRWTRRTSTSGRATTCRGSPTASGRTSASRARPSATCRSTSSSSSRCGTAPTRPAW
jgi:myo-inositol-1-phosphate synthase